VLHKSDYIGQILATKFSSHQPNPPKQVFSPEEENKERRMNFWAVGTRYIMKKVY
jgi:hypothetical protein